MRKTLFTIGHSTHSLEYFTNLLVKQAIQAVCDVRSVPYSRHNPQFNREPLKEHLATTGISYVFLGNELGARSSNPRCYLDGKVQYNYLAEEPTFLEGLRRIQKGIESLRVALMCAERDPLMCHRTILVCRELRSEKLEISHILPDGTIETNVAAEKRLMSTMNIRPDMSNSEIDCIEQAYDKQANDIAHAIDAKKTGQHVNADLHNRLHEKVRLR